MIIKHFEGDPKEFIESTQKTEMPKECQRFFCHFCLRGSYDAMVDEVKNKKDWQCPYCTGVCFCSRCTRFDKILKLIGFYVSLGGELNELYDTLITKSDILDKLNNHMLISNLIVVINDLSIKPIQIIKNMTKVEGKNTKKIDNDLSKCESYRNNLNGIQSYYDRLFMKARIDKCLLAYDKYISDICLENDDRSTSFIKQKRNRKEQKKLLKIVNSFWKKFKLSKQKKYKSKHRKDEDEQEEEEEDDDKDNEEDNGDEESEDDIDNEGSKEKDKEQTNNLTQNKEIKKKRGRPRKYPLPEVN